MNAEITVSCSCFNIISIIFMSRNCCSESHGTVCMHGEGELPQDHWYLLYVCKVPQSAVAAMQPSRRPSELRVVCDTMLTGLGRQLRCCGVDVRLVDADTSHEAAAKVPTQSSAALPLTLLDAGYFCRRSVVCVSLSVCWAQP